MTVQPQQELRSESRVPRIGFLGVGWIGLNRMKAMSATGTIRPAAIADPVPEMAEAARRIAPGAEIVASFEAILDQDLDGIVIATPSAMHAEQSIRALERGVAVFCQKPLGRTADEVARVVEAARASDRLLGVDLSYRFTTGLQQVRSMIAGGRLGKVFSADLVFHNAYGPDKPWFYDKALSGGGCVIDLGVHLVDMALWALDFPAVARVEGTLFHQGGALRDDGRQVEDYAIATIELANGGVIRLACSWRLHAGQDAVIRATFHGTEASAEMRNVDGSFYDFVAEHFSGTQRHLLAAPPEDWGGRAAADWAAKLANGRRFEPDCEKFVDIARILDRICSR